MIKPYSSLRVCCYSYTMSNLYYLWIIILVACLVCPGLLGRVYFFCFWELLKGLQNLETHDDEGSMHKMDTSLQEVPPLCEHVNEKLKLMCRCGGRILPRPYDGKLRYVGGQTRIISVDKRVTFSELMQKLVNAYGQSLVLKYQLPDEELDSLVSVTCDEDLQNMIEEYESHPRVRLFLSSEGAQKYFDVSRDKEELIRSSSRNSSRDSVSAVHKVQSTNEKDSGSLNSLLRQLPSSASLFAFMVGNAKENPNPAASNAFQSPRTTEDAFQSPLSHFQGLDMRTTEFEAVGRGLQVIKNVDLEELQELGSGTFGTVYHGKWRGTDVAIKRIKTRCFSEGPSQREKMKAKFWSEASLLAQLHHPNIMAFYGVVPDGRGGTLGTVTEYMVDGSLKHVLQRKDRPIDHYKRVLLAMDAAFGMEYLHAKNIVHFDVKSENLLVNMRDPQRPICKVGDFGLSKIKHQTFVSGGVQGTLPWMAPELLQGSNNMVSEKVDVYSFGIVMWELLTGGEPYANMHYPAIIGGVLSNSLRPPVPHNCDPQWRALMEACWSSDPSARPSFTDVVGTLRAMAIYS